MSDVVGVTTVEAGGRDWTVPIKKVTASLTIIISVLAAVGTAIGEVVLVLDQGQWEDVNTAAGILFVGALWSIWQRFKTKMPIAWGGGNGEV